MVVVVVVTNIVITSLWQNEGFEGSWGAAGAGSSPPAGEKFRLQRLGHAAPAENRGSRESFVALKTVVAADFHIVSGEIVSVAHFRCDATHKCVILNTERPYRVETKTFQGKCLVLFEHIEVVSTQNLHTDQGKMGGYDWTEEEMEFF